MIFIEAPTFILVESTHPMPANHDEEGQMGEKHLTEEQLGRRLAELLPVRALAVIESGSIIPAGTAPAPGVRQPSGPPGWRIGI